MFDLLEWTILSIWWIKWDFVYLWCSFEVVFSQNARQSSYDTKTFPSFYILPTWDQGDSCNSHHDSIKKCKHFPFPFSLPHYLGHNRHQSRIFNKSITGWHCTIRMKILIKASFLLFWHAWRRLALNGLALSLNMVRKWGREPCSERGSMENSFKK